MLPSEYLEKGWTQHEEAVDCKGRTIFPGSQDAVAWCMIGAIRASVYDGEYGPRAEKQFRNLFSMIGIKSIANYNDDPNRVHYEVIEIMKQAEQEMEKNNVA